jgi:hypothetical protein
MPNDTLNLDYSLINHWQEPDSRLLGNNIEECLLAMPGPTRILLPGADTSRCRVLVTLLHGNEPSGFTALHRLLREGVRPAVNVYCYVIATQAASLPPRFSHRQVPWKRDYNRCFRPPYDSDDQGPVCQSLLQEIQALQPEAVVDMHNTSGEGPAFGVTTSYDVKHDDIVSLFTDRLIVTNLRLGSIMETNTEVIPVVTIECGGAFEATADRVAYEGLQRYFTRDSLFSDGQQDYGIDMYYNPLRVEMHEAVSLVYGDSYVAGSDITLKTEIEHHNFGRVTPDTLLGWVGPAAMERLAAFDATRVNHFREFYREDSGALYPRFNQKLFMITGNAAIAMSDCLWYVVPD